MTDTPVQIGLYAIAILLLCGAWLAYKYMPIKWIKIVLIVFFLSLDALIIYGLHIQRDDVAIFHKK
jgi:hypothetical protein